MTAGAEPADFEHVLVFTESLVDSVIALEVSGAVAGFELASKTGGAELADFEHVLVVAESLIDFLVFLDTVLPAMGSVASFSTDSLGALRLSGCSSMTAGVATEGVATSCFVWLGGSFSDAE